MWLKGEKVYIPERNNKEEENPETGFSWLGGSAYKTYHGTTLLVGLRITRIPQINGFDLLPKILKADTKSRKYLQKLGHSSNEVSTAKEFCL